MKPYCGWKRANKNGVRTCKTLGPCPSWHRPAGVARHEFLATRRAAKRAERQAAKIEISEEVEEMSTSEKKYIVVIVDFKDKTYWSHQSFPTLAEAQAFAKGMDAAWEISHGPANCWGPLVLDNPYNRTEWEEMGSPGKDKIKE